MTEATSEDAIRDGATSESVLRRKLAPRPAAPALDMPFDDIPPDPGGRALPRAFGRAASQAAGLVAQGRSRASRTGTLAELLDLVDPLGFVGLLTSADGAPGLVMIDPTGAAALIEAMTIGTLARQPPAPRRPTRTDAALLGDLVDAVLTELDANPDPADDLAPGYCFERRVDDLRLLGVMLEDVDFTLGVLGFDLHADTTSRAGEFIVALPQPALSFAPLEPELPAPSVLDLPDTRWQTALENAVHGAPAELGAALGRVTLPLSEVMALGIGSQLLMPLSLLEEVQLETLDRRTLGHGRLGQFRGQRALRLTALAFGSEDQGALYEGGDDSGTAMKPDHPLPPPEFS